MSEETTHKTVLKGFRDEVKEVVITTGYALATVGLFWGAYRLLHLLFSA